MKHKHLLPAFLLLAGLLQPCLAAAETSPEVIRLNNEGVKAVNNSDWQGATDLFAAALKIQPDNRLARQNLAIAQDKWGLQLKSSPDKALFHLHKALLLNFSDASTRKSVDEAVKLLGKNPTLVADRIALADTAANDSEYTGAATEYLIALSLHDDTEIRKKLDDVFRHVDPFYRKTSAYEDFRSDTKVDDGAYMTSIDSKIKQGWNPPADSTSRRVVINFEIDPSGHPTHPRIAHSSHQSEFDQNALKSIQNIETFGPLPKSARGLMAMQIAFDYDASSGDKILSSNIQGLGLEVP